ncbi:MAG: urate hydroxylase PuuD [Acidobacteria bacterium]|nr:urate hydroxylase PuuD [Acidobacteriota bacterium]
MALSDLYTNFQLLFRWLHVIAGIVWIGHLYFFNFVNVPFQGTIGGDVKKAVNPQLLPRALWWFRWGAMITFLTGLVLFTQLYMYAPGAGFGVTALFWTDQGITARAIWILIGMLFGTIMWFNVWFIIWPAQKKIISAVRDGVAADPKLGKRALLASRTNAYLSGPMLFGMLSPSHYGAINMLTALVAIALGLVAIWWAIKTAPTVGRSI